MSPSSSAAGSSARWARSPSSYDDQRPEAFELCIRWKAAQYLASGYENLFAREACVKLFRRLRERGVLVVASLSAGDRIVAAHLGTLHAQRQTWWVPAYDVELARYSPGRLLLEAALQESQARKHLEFDFLIGDEGYKYLYATHERVIGPVGDAGAASSAPPSRPAASPGGRSPGTRRPSSSWWACAIAWRRRPSRRPGPPRA